MIEGISREMPRARQEKLLVHELTDEVLVYDLERHKAHCLNKTAALVWNRCDGETGVAEIARLLGDKLDTEFDENLVRLALQQLDRAHLLGETTPRPGENSRVSRRQLMRTLGWSAAVALPLVSSILAPTAQAQVSCKVAGTACANKSECCAPLNCSGSPRICN
jgi:coenzyme PQQ synthesis protein D (PqqD)